MAASGVNIIDVITYEARRATSGCGRSKKPQIIPVFGMKKGPTCGISSSQTPQGGVAMSNLRSIVEQTAGRIKEEISEQDEWKEAAPESRGIKKRIHAKVDEVFAFLEGRGDRATFDGVEKALVRLVFMLGRLFLAYFLAWRQEHSEKEIEAARCDGFWPGDPQPRLLGTFFGKVRYWRTYMRDRDGGGVYPLDAALGLTADGFSMLVLSLAARLATVVSFDQVTGLLLTFLSWSPSKTSVEKAVLGFGRCTTEWFEKAPPPGGDGEVLVIQFDGKATPTATEGELEKRRGTRRPNPYPDSPRHRGREKRRRRGSKPRRKKGDKAKNGKAATLVVMYTLKIAQDAKGLVILKGPINRKVYASYAKKGHAFAIARREADKRGFTAGSGKTIQIVTDGDLGMESLIRDTFPEATHTLDIMHALDYLWTAGECLHKEGSPELVAWIEDMKGFMYAGKVKLIIRRLKKALEEKPKKGPGNKGKRKRLAAVINYYEKRVHMMDYGHLAEQDLEIGSGSVEGAVKHVIGKRFDYGSMRWIKERAEALLQLRCIEINGDWDSFVAFVHQKLRAKATRDMELQALMTSKVSPLPTYGLAA
jgi:hypothetical protein